MADKPLVEVDRTMSASVAEVEQFKLERSAVKAFLSELSLLVSALELRIGVFHPVVASMKRFLRSRR